MTRARLPRLIGVIHLEPLPGAPGAKAGEYPAGVLQRAGMRAIQEARLLEKNGFDAVIIENFGDIPFYKDKVPPETVASLAVIAAALREAIKIPIGINVLRNDASAALAIASVTGCDFIRVNVLSGVAATDQGMIEGRAAELLREKARLSSDVAIFADVDVKHARTLSSDSIELMVEEAAQRAGADAVIVSGPTTGRSVSTDKLRMASAAAKRAGCPLYIGSGATAETVRDLRKQAQGVIVSSALRKGGRAGAPLDPKRVRAFAKAFGK